MSGVTPEPGEIELLLQSHNIEYRPRQGGKELAFACPNGCDDDRRPTEEFHCNINTESGLMHCFKCNLKGNLINFKKKVLGESMAETQNVNQPRGKKVEYKGRPATKLSTIVTNAQRALTADRKKYFLNRGITEESIEKYQLGFYADHSGEWYTIPIFQKGECIDIKLRSAVEGQSPKYRHLMAGAKVAIYGLDEFVVSPSDSVLICGGEFDKIIADQMDFHMPVITSTGGERTFKDEWIKEFLTNRRNVYLCFDNDETGLNSMSILEDKISSLCPESSVFVILIPDELGDKADITDVFLHGYTAEQLLERAEFVDGAEPINSSNFAEMGIDDLASILDFTIKHDRYSKVILFLAMLSAYTEKDQLNISFNGRSGTGKTYITEEVARFFPKTDVMSYGKITPTAFFYSEQLSHTNDETGEQVVDVSRKILIFLDQLDCQLQANLRPLLSHDDKKIPFLLTNKNGRGQNVAKGGYLLGYPTTVFCSANMVMDEQEQTRCILLSPETSDEKIEASLSLIERKNDNSQEFIDSISSDPKRKLLKDRILYIKQAHIRSIDIPKELNLKRCFMDGLGDALPPRASREFTKLSAFVKVLALLNLPFRERRNDAIVATAQDVKEALRLWEPLRESQSYGVPPQTFDFYKEIILPASRERGGIAITVKDISRYYFEQKRDLLPDNLLRKNYLISLETAGLITCKKGDGAGQDKRSLYITPIAMLDATEDLFNPNLECDVSGVF